MAGRAGFTALEGFLGVGKIDGQEDKDKTEENAECYNARSSLDHRLARILKQNPSENQVNPAVVVEWRTDFAYNLAIMNLPPRMRIPVVLAILCTLFIPSSSSTVSPQEAVRNLEKRLASLHSLQADFDQAYFPASIATPLEERGRFSFERPERMRWEYLEPEPKVYIYKEGLSLAYFPEDNQLFRYALTPEEKDSAIFTLLTGRARIEDEYLVEAGDLPSERKDRLQLKLTPKKESEFSHILLEIDQGTWLIEKAVFFDLGGNRQEFRFRRSRANPRLGPATFELKVPPGAEIIEDLPPPKK
jgi:outer membrane lipoprotein carrier protein